MQWQPLPYSVVTPLTAASRPILLIGVLVPDDVFTAQLPYFGAVGLLFLMRFTIQHSLRSVPTADWWATLPRFAPYKPIYGKLLWGVGLLSVPLLGLLLGFPTVNVVSVTVLAVVWTKLAIRFRKEDIKTKRAQTTTRKDYRILITAGAALLVGGPVAAAILGYQPLTYVAFYGSVFGTLVATTMVGVATGVVAVEGHDFHLTPP